jgi:Protein of unknown function (DUF3040)
MTRADYSIAPGVADGGMSDDQLSQHERIVLGVLEESLELDDPAFVVRFAADAQALDGARRWWSPLWWLNHWHKRNREP